MTPQHLLGVAEIAAMLGVTRQRVNQLLQSDDFPPPEAELSAGRIWRRDAVEAWAAAHPTRTPAMVGPAFFGNFSDAARAVIIRAQEEARSLRHGYLGTEHLLLAVLSDAAPEVRERLAALGFEHGPMTEAVLTRAPSTDTAPVGHLPFTPRSKAILADATYQAVGPVEPADVARAVARLADGIAAELLRERAGLTQDELVTAIDGALADAGEGVFVPRTPPENAALVCSFCGRPQAQVGKLIAGPDVYICDACVDLCNQIIGTGRPDRALLAERVEQLSAELDQLRRDLHDG